MSLFAAACGSLSSPIVLTAPGQGYRDCARLSVDARIRATDTSGWGWAFSIAGAGAAATGTTVLPLDGTLSRSEKIVAGSLVAGGALLFAIGQAWIKRSDAASTLAGETAALLDNAKPDDTHSEAITVGKCNAALGAWERSRTDGTAVAASLLQDQKAETKAAEDKAKNAPAQVPVNQEKEKTQQKRLDFKLELLKLKHDLKPEELQQLSQ